MPPPANVLAEPEVRLIVPVPVTVRLVDVEALHGEVPAIVQVPEPTATVLAVVVLVATEEPEEFNVTLNPFASKVPCVTANMDDEHKNAS